MLGCIYPFLVTKTTTYIPSVEHLIIYMSPNNTILVYSSQQFFFFFLISWFMGEDPLEQEMFKLGVKSWAKSLPVNQAEQ